MDWKQVVADHIHHAPFVLAAKNGVDHRKLDLVRILEGLIVAGITGMIVMYGVQQKLDAQLAEIKARIDDIRLRIAEERAENIARDNRLADKVDAMHGMNGKAK